MTDEKVPGGSYFDADIDLTDLMSRVPTDGKIDKEVAEAILRLAMGGSVLLTFSIEVYAHENGAGWNLHKDVPKSVREFDEVSRMEYHLGRNVFNLSLGQVISAVPSGLVVKLIFDNMIPQMDAWGMWSTRVKEAWLLSPAPE